MEKRNIKIYLDWIEGKDYKYLAKEFGLAPATIKEICLRYIPIKIQKLPWQRMNQYKKWREYYRRQRASTKDEVRGSEYFASDPTLQDE